MHFLLASRRRGLMPPRSRHVRQGVAALELALVLPLLLLLTFGCIEVGRAAQARMVLSSAVHAGATYAATHRYSAATYADWELAVRSAVTDAAGDMPHFDSGRLTCDVVTQSDGDGVNDVTVSAEYPLESIVSWPGLDAFPLACSLTMRQYR